MRGRAAWGAAQPPSKFFKIPLVTDNPSDYTGGVSNEAHTSDAYLGDSTMPFPPSIISPESCCPVPPGLREETMMYPSPIRSLVFEGAEAISVTHASTPAVEAVEPEGLILEAAVTYCEVILRITFTKSERRIRQWLREIDNSTWSTDFKRYWEIDAQSMIADAGLGDAGLGDEFARVPTLHHAYHVLRGGVHYVVLHATC